MLIVLLYSGGLDSRIMAHYAKVKYPKAEVKCLYYAHGAPAEQNEISTLPDFVEVRRLDWLTPEKGPVAKATDPAAGAIYIPGRNMVFATLAACQELPDQIWLGALKDEQHEQATDKNQTFADLAGETLEYVLSPFLKGSLFIRAPLAEMKWTKLSSLEWALTNGLSAEEVLKTVSCYGPHGKPCGNCRACIKRAVNFGAAGLYEEHVDEGPLHNTYGQDRALEYFNLTNPNFDEQEMIRVLKLLYSSNPKLGIFNPAVVAAMMK